MTLNIIFVFSGLALLAVIASKILEDKTKQKPALLRLISLGDERIRNWSHELAHKYAEGKESAHFFVNKQLPLHTKNIFNKTSTTLKDRAEKYIGDIRGSKFLKKSDGLSEFFKSISEKQGQGRIDETFDLEGSQNEEDGVK